MQLTYLVPENVEASIMALIDATFVWSYEVGARVSAAAFCAIWNVEDEQLDNYKYMLMAKGFVILVLVVLAPILIPRNEEIQDLAGELRE